MISLPSFSTAKYGKHSIKYLGRRLWSKVSRKANWLPVSIILRQGYVDLI